MRPLNRPMFKMGGPVKEGIMDGIREPETIGGGTIVGEDKGGGRTGFVNPLLLAGGAITARVAPLLARAKGLFGTNVARQFTPVARQTITTGGRNPGTMLGGFQRTGPTQTATSFQLNPFGQYLASSPSGQLATGLIKGATSKTAKGFAQKAGKLATDPLTLLTAGLYFNPFKGDEPEIEDQEGRKSVLPGQDPKPNVDTKVEVNEQGGSAPSNQFNDDGTRKDTSVERLLKGIVKRAKADAAADTAIEFGRKLRTGEASLKDPSSAIDVASEQFSKPAELQQKVDLALIENELKKQQIAAQAKATTERALDIEKRKREITTMGDLVRADKSGQGLTHVGTLGIAREFADLTGKKFRGSIGNDEKLAEFEKNERFKIDELGIITEQLLQGDDGLYILGTRVYEKTGPIVKLIKT
jgi:hypothetical protein